MKKLTLWLAVTVLAAAGAGLLALWLQEPHQGQETASPTLSTTPALPAPAIVWADGQAFHLLTAENRPANLLSLAGVALYPGDLIWSGGQTVPTDQPLSPAPFYSVQVQRALPIWVTEGSQLHSFTSTAATLGQALWQAGIRLRLTDRTSLPLETALADPQISQVGLRLELVRSRELAIQAGGEEFFVRSAASQVGEALAETGLGLQGLDYTIPDEDSPIPEDGRIRVVRVSESVLIEQTPLPFEKEFQPAADVELDQQEIIQTGEYGLSARRVRVRYEDGVEVSRQTEGEWVAVQPKNRIVGYGTKVVMHTLDTPNGPVYYWRALSMWATSYHPSNTGNTTASGLPLKKGVAAIDRRYIPFYTRMYIPGYGEAVAADVGGGVIGRWIDLGYSDDDYESWHQWVTVYFLWPPPDNIVWIIP